MKKIIKDNIKKIQELCNNFNVSELYTFGSVNTSNFSEKSDIDFLVTFNENLPLLDYADNYFDFKFSLTDFLKREIDLVTERSLSNPYLIDSINSTKKLLYEQGNKKIFA